MEVLPLPVFVSILNSSGEALKMELERELLSLCLNRPAAEICPGSGNSRIVPADWQGVMETARAEGLASILYKCLRGGRNLLPQKYMEDLKQEYFLTRTLNKYYFRELVRCLKAMDMPVILLKGAALLPTVYDDLGERPLGDFDILIQYKDLERVKKCLGALGYKYQGGRGPYVNRITFYRPEELVLQLEAHWHIENGMFPNIEAFPVETLWQAAIPVEIEDYRGLILAPHHQILHLTIHALRHSYDRLVLLWDIHLVVDHYKERLNWEELIREASEFYLSRPLYYGLYLTKLLLNTDVPQDVLNRLRPRSLSLEERMFTRFIGRGIRRPGLQYLLYFSMNRGVRKKLKFLWWAFFPPRDILAEMGGLDDSAVGATYWFKCISRRFKSAWQFFVEGLGVRD